MLAKKPRLILRLIILSGVLPGLLPGLAMAQRTLVLTDAQTGAVRQVRQGDKVLLAFKASQRAVDNQPTDVFVLQPKDYQDSTFVHLKTRVMAITDSTIVLKNGRAMRLSKLAGVRKLSLGKQGLRTAVTVVGYGGLFLGAVLLGQRASGRRNAPVGFWPSLGTAVTGAILLDFVKDEVPANHLQRWRVSVCDAALPRLVP